jgi:hypothetical protein
MKESTKENYINRVDRAVILLSEHIDDTPSLEMLADAATISP